MKPYVRRVFYYETDQMGIVHHSNYIRWMEEARIDYFRQSGLEYESMEKEGIIMPVTFIECNYKVSARFGESIYIVVTPIKFTGARATLQYEILKEDKTVAAEGTTGHCFLDAKTMSPVNLKKRMPDYSKRFQEVTAE